MAASAPTTYMVDDEIRDEIAVIEDDTRKGVYSPEQAKAMRPRLRFLRRAIAARERRAGAGTEQRFWAADTLHAEAARCWWASLSSRVERLLASREYSLIFSDGTEQRFWAADDEEARVMAAEMVDSVEPLPLEHEDAPPKFSATAYRVVDGEADGLAVAELTS